MRELAASPRECLKHKVGQKRSSVKPVGHPGKPAPEGSATAMATPADFIEEGRMDRLPAGPSVLTISSGLTRNDC